MIIIGIDPSLRGTGYGVIDWNGQNGKALAMGTIVNPASIPLSKCLVRIHDKIQEVVTRFKPDQAAVEGVIYVQNTRTAITLGAARGASILALAESGISIFEYPPRSIKKASTGYGGAAKAQVGFMMRAMLGLTQTPTSDESDALAIALTHAQSKVYTPKNRKEL